MPNAYTEEQLVERPALGLLQTTDMALVVSPGQKEIEQMRGLGLDIAPHRQRMNESQPPWIAFEKDRTYLAASAFLFVNELPAAELAVLWSRLLRVLLPTSSTFILPRQLRPQFPQRN